MFCFAIILTYLVSAVQPQNANHFVSSKHSCAKIRQTWTAFISYRGIFIIFRIDFHKIKCDT